MDSDEEPISRAPTIQIRAEANLTVRSPRAYFLCLPRAGSTPEFLANGGNCLTSPSNWQRRQVVDSEVAGSSALGFGAYVHTLRAVQGADVAQATFRSARHAGGLSVASIRINAPRFCMKWSSTASAGIRTVWSK